MVGLADLYELTGEYEEAYALYDAARQREAGNARLVRDGIDVAKARRVLRGMGVVDEAFSSKEMRGQNLGPLWPQAG